MAKWSLNDIPWNEFDSSKVQPQLLSLVKAASMVEYNGHDYARYLCDVFQGDTEFQEVARNWAEEEVQHGAALRKWAELADPSFNFEQSFALFKASYQLPLNVEASVRGSKSGELIARCIVETGTSSYYTAIKDASDEPVLRIICAKIAADELRHYKLFYSYLKTYLEKENIGFFKRLGVAWGRIAESEDDELASAYFAAHNHNSGNAYDHELYKNFYMAGAYSLYRREHVERMTGMVFKAVGLTPHTWLNRTVDRVAWAMMRYRSAKLKPYRVQAA